VDKEANIARGAPQHKPKGEFDPPWVYILADANDKLKAYLLWQQTFAISSLAFNVVPFDMSIRSWVIMNLSGDPIANNIKAMHNALGAIKGTLWKSEDFCRIANQCLVAADDVRCPMAGLRNHMPKHSENSDIKLNRKGFNLSPGSHDSDKN
jgi:hypothetical protein